MTHDRLAVTRVKIPAFIESAGFFDGHPHILAKMVGPRRYQVFETEHAGVIQAFIEPALKRAVAPAGSLHLLHEQPEFLAIPAIDLVINCYGDRSLVGIRNDGQIVSVVKRGLLDLGLRSEIN